MKKLNDEELQKQLDTATRFLRLVHPTLEKGDDRYACVEIRPIHRKKPNEKMDFKISRSMPLWRLDEKGLDYLKGFFINRNGENVCINYSVFNFDKNRETFTKSGEKAKKGRINSNNARYTNEIALDFDGISSSEFDKYGFKLLVKGIEGIEVSTGHGFHLHILLAEKTYDKTALLSMVYLFRAKGFMADEKCIDPARVFRLPGTFNAKCFASEKYSSECNNPPQCEVLQWTDKRFTIEEIVNALLSFDTVNVEDWDKYQKLVEAIKFDETKEAQESGFSYDLAIAEHKAKVENASGRQQTIKIEQTIETKHIEYTQLAKFELPSPVSAMLSVCEEGYRNSALGFLISLLSRNLKLSKKSTFEIVEKWGKEACKPTYTNIREDFERLYAQGGMSYTTHLAKRYGVINFDNFVSIQKRTNVLIPNGVFKKLQSFKGNGLAAYLTVKILEHTGEPSTVENIAKEMGVTIKTARTSLDEANKAGFIFIKEGNKRKKEANIYCTHKIIAQSEGFMMFSYNDIKAYVNELNKSELKIYIYMRFLCDANICYKSQSGLGETIGITRTATSKLIKKLEEKYFISTERDYISNNVVISCTYTLLR